MVWFGWQFSSLRDLGMLDVAQIPRRPMKVARRHRSIERTGITVR